MAADNAQLGKIERDVIEVGNGPPRFGWRQRTGVTDLQTEWDVELDAFGVERVIAAVIRRQVPEPRQNAQRAKAQFANRAAQLSHRGHRPGEVDRRDPDQAVWAFADKGR